MQVRNIVKVVQRSEHVFEIRRDEISAEDILSVIKLLSKSLCELGNIYLGNYYSADWIVGDTQQVKPEEADILFAGIGEKNISDFLDRRYTIAELETRAMLNFGSRVKKPEIIKRLASDFCLLRKYFLEDICRELVVPEKELSDLKSIEKSGYRLYFCMEAISDLAPGTKQVQWWTLQLNHGYQSSRNKEPQIDLLADETEIKRQLEDFSEQVESRGDIMISYRCKQLLTPKKEPEAVEFKLEMEDLENRYKVRKGNKRATLIEGLRSCYSERLVKSWQGRRILILHRDS